MSANNLSRISTDRDFLTNGDTIMQSLIQQIGIRTGTLLMRRRPQSGLVPAYVGAHRARDLATAAEAAKTADEQIKMLSGVLQSVCRKLLAKIRELDRVNNELNDLMKVCAIPAIFVDETLTVRSFTRESRQVYRLSQQDIGRSLLDVTCGLNYRTLSDDFRKAAQTGKAVNRHLEQRGCTVRYFLRILPNFCRDNSFGGAALIFSQVEGRDWRTA
jgi:two-component system CheB/CheR fusion protein